MIESRVRLIPLANITFPEGRRSLDYSKVYEYACSIAQQGLMQDIGVNVDNENLILVWGGHRYTAFQLCNEANEGQTTTLTSQYSKDQLDELRDLLSLATKHYDHWSKIPTKHIKGASPLLLSVLELSENLSRYGLAWQEKASAVSAIHKQAVADARSHRESWSDNATAKLIGCSRELVSQLLQPTRKLTAITDTKVRERAEAAIKESKSALSAANAVESIAKRHGLSTKPSLSSILKIHGQPTTAKPASEPEPVVDSSLSLGAQSILCANFHEWAQAYTGPKFNFIHCDFPYGINYNTGGNFNSGASAISVGNYDDSPTIYWDLLTTLCTNRLLDSSAHIMFWFSLNMLEATKKFFSDNLADAVIQSHFMIWVHPSKQTTPDAKRYGQRNYETAMLLTLGDRPIVRPKHLATIHEEIGTKLHRSQKPKEVLNHFMSMFVDPSTRMLDPTCGSGTSVLTAHMLGAQSVLGLELDPEMQASAVKHFDEVTK